MSEAAVITAKTSQGLRSSAVLSAEGIDDQIVRMLCRKPNAIWTRAPGRTFTTRWAKFHWGRRQVCRPRRRDNLREVLIHGGLAHNLKTRIIGSRPRALNPRPATKLRQYDGVLVLAAGKTRYTRYDPRDSICASRRCRISELSRHAVRHAGVC